MGETHEPFDYNRDVIDVDSRAAADIADASEQTWYNHPAIEVHQRGRHGMRVVRAEDRHYFVSGGFGDPQEKDPHKHAASLVDHLVDEAVQAGLEPVALVDIMVWNGDEASGIFRQARSGLIDAANKRGVGVINGEDAVHIQRAPGLNASGSLISIAKEPEQVDRRRFGHLPPSDRAVIGSADGAGTKPGFIETMYALQRTDRWQLPDNRSAFRRLPINALDMVADDMAKFGVRPRQIVWLTEYTGNGPTGTIKRAAHKEALRFRIDSLYRDEDIGSRIIQGDMPFRADSGAVGWGYIADRYLTDRPRARPGQHLIALGPQQGKENARVNGFTGCHLGLPEALEYARKQEKVDQWYETRFGQEIIEYLTRPPTVLMRTFLDALSADRTATVFHNSGGAWDKKLAKQLAADRLRADFHETLNPHHIEKAIIGMLGISMDEGYGSRPVGTDGFVATHDPDKIRAIAASHGIRTEPGAIAALIPAEMTEDGRAGVTFPAYNGERVEFLYERG